MIAVFIITGLVAAFSLYDYFSSKSWQQVTSSDRNTIVFENRNLEYGAYQIRTDYNKRLIWIVLSITLLIGAAFTTYKIIQNNEEPIKEEATVDLTAFAPDAEEEEEEIVEPLEQEIPPAQQTIQFIAPEIDNDAVEETVVTVEETKDTPVSNETQDGNDSFGDIVKDEGVPTQTEKPKEPEVFEYVEEFAEFPGGPAALKKYLAENIIYPPTAVELGVQGTPGFFINGRFLGGAFPFEAFKEIIDKEIAGTATDNCEDYSEEMQTYCSDPANAGFIPEAREVAVGNSAVKGKADAKVTIVEFSDFECPFCVRAFPTVQQIVETYPNDVRLVYKHLPLTNIHPNAERAAIASECARDQGKFWELHDKMFSTEI